MNDRQARYAVVQVNLDRVHLLDRSIPEPTNGGDRTQLACEIFTAGPYDARELDTLSEDAGDFGRISAVYRLCPWCYSRAWQEYRNR